MNHPNCVKKYSYNKVEYYMCYICSVSKEYDAIQIEYHLKSKNHIQRMEELFCKTCCLQCKSKSSYVTHTQTKHHKTQGKSFSYSGSCEPCNVIFISRIDEERHSQTTKHAKRLEMRKLTDCVLTE
jgi:hypothetical protein